jgi:hypothetical protein
VERWGERALGLRDDELVEHDEVGGGQVCGHYSGCFVAFEMKPGERQWWVLGEWPPKPSRG